MLMLTRMPNGAPQLLVVSLMNAFLLPGQACYDSVTCGWLNHYCAQQGPLSLLEDVNCYGKQLVPVCEAHNTHCQDFKPPTSRRPMPSTPAPPPTPLPSPPPSPPPPSPQPITAGPRTNPPPVGTTTQPNQPCINLNQLRNDALERTNYYRRKHSVDGLTNSAGMESLAQSYAEKVVREFTTPDKVNHSGSGYGENMALLRGSPGTASRLKGFSAIDQWYNEVVNYDFDRAGRKNDDHSKIIGHFTQLVWKASKEVGHGFAANADCSLIFIVANYNPQGNWVNNFRENVLPPRD